MRIADRPIRRAVWCRLRRDESGDLELFCKFIELSAAHHDQRQHVRHTGAERSPTVSHLKQDEKYARTPRPEGLDQLVPIPPLQFGSVIAWRFCPCVQPRRPPAIHAHVNLFLLSHRLGASLSLQKSRSLRLSS